MSSILGLGSLGGHLGTGDVTLLAVIIALRRWKLLRQDLAIIFNVAESRSLQGFWSDRMSHVVCSHALIGWLCRGVKDCMNFSLRSSLI